MQNHPLDIEPRSVWLCATPSSSVQELGFYCTEAGTFYCHQNYTTQRSFKNSVLLLYTFGGCGQLECEGTTLEAAPGTLLLLDCRRPHRYYTRPGAEKWNFHWAHVAGSGVEGYFHMLEIRGCAGCTPSGSDAALPDAWQALLDAACQYTRADAFSVSLQIHRILQTAAMEFGRNGAESDPTHATMMEHVAAYIRAHYEETLSLEELARRATLSQSYFIRLFRQQLGTTPYDYLLRCRITKSKVFLSTTSLSVAQIAERVGFCNVANYVAQFSRLCGHSPLQYRRLHTNLQDE